MRAINQTAVSAKTYPRKKMTAKIVSSQISITTRASFGRKIYPKELLQKMFFKKEFVSQHYPTPYQVRELFYAPQFSFRFLFPLSGLGLFSDQLFPSARLLISRRGKWCLTRRFVQNNNDKEKTESQTGAEIVSEREREKVLLRCEGKAFSKFGKRQRWW